MKLTVDIGDREEMAAAVALMQTILAGTVTPARIVPASPLASDGFPALIDTAAAGLSGADPAVVFGGQPQQPDPAQVFGGQPAASANPFAPPTGAPSTAGANPFQNAPVGQPAGDPNANTGASPFAPPTGQSAAAPTAGAMGANPANGVELDSTGLPWDGRIHASTKTKTKPGEWTAKRGMNDEGLVNRIKAELRASLAAGSPNGAALPAALQPAQTMLPQMPGAGPFVPPAASFPPAPPAAPLEPAGPPTTFTDLMKRVVPFVQSGALPVNAVEQAAAYFQLPGLTALQQNEAKYVGPVWNLIQQYYPGVK